MYADAQTCMPMHKRESSRLLVNDSSESLEVTETGKAFQTVAAEWINFNDSMSYLFIVKFWEHKCCGFSAIQNNYYYYQQPQFGNIQVLFRLIYKNIIMHKK